MRNAYLEGKDLYSVIAAQSFNYPYEQCLEFYPEGTEIEIDGQKVICGNKTHQNKDGKSRRTQAKSILLGILYGRGAASVGEQIGKTKEEAEEILDKFFSAFPTVKTWINESQEGCRKNGYVEDVAGRRRRLPDINLPRFTVRYKDPNKSTGDFNPFIGCQNRTTGDKVIEDYKKQIEAAKSKKQTDAVKAKAYSDGVEIIANGGFISQAERQCVNARVQGSAATLTKCALIEIYYDKRIADIGAYLVNTVHDEILLEVPEENSDEAARLLNENMIESAKTWVPLIPMKSDNYDVAMWYQDEMEVTLQSEYKHLLDDGLTEADAENKVISNHAELLSNQVSLAIRGKWVG